MTTKHLLANSLAKFAATCATGLALAVVAPLAAHAADVLLSGSIKSAAGEKMGGVTVSAKEDGKTITTSVYTDESGDYVFPPLASGKYRVWAQAVGFETAKNEIDLGAVKHQDLTLSPIKDFERQVEQLPGDMILAGLPDQTPDDKRMKQIVRNNCTSCHTPSYTMQHRFDEAGWNAIIAVMKTINVYGVYRPKAVNPVLDFHQAELAHYLAKARGPDDERIPDQAAAAPVRRSGARRVPRIRRPAQSRPATARHDGDERRQRLDQGHAVARRLAAA